jgi:hypothetical protein
MGGDVNKDNVIDILAKDYIKTNWGTNKHEAASILMVLSIRKI